MRAKLNAPVPEIPVSDLARAILFYRSRLGFVLDWKYEEVIAGVSRGEARIFIHHVPEGSEGSRQSVRIWLNLDSVAEVDALHLEWREAGVPILSAPEQKPWGLYEFIASDCDGNSYRVFHDTETPKQKGESL